MNILIAWLIRALIILAVAYLLPGVHLAGLTIALVVAFVLGVINIFLKPILVVLTLPVNILTLGLFTFIINAFIIILTSKLVPGFKVDSFWWAFLFSILLSVVSSILL